MEEKNHELFLIDSNILLEMLLGQGRAKECVLFFNKLAQENLNFTITAFALYSTEIITFANGKLDILRQFLSNLQSLDNFSIYHTSLSDELEVIDQAERLSLDFDDSLQYFVAQKTNSSIVSFDKHFDKTDIKRLEPQDLL
jgi:uncharacterized protein